VEAGRKGHKSGQDFCPYSEGNPSAPPLLERLEAAGTTIIEQQIRLGGAVLALTDRRMATERASSDGISKLVLFGLTFDYRKTSRLALEPADQASNVAVSCAYVLLQKADITVSLIAGRPCLVIMRTLAILSSTKLPTQFFTA